MWKTIKSVLALCGAIICITAAIETSLASVAYAQVGGGNSSVSGTVSDSFGPVVGASVIIKGSTLGTTTTSDGAFSLSNVKAGDVLIVSFIGYETQEVPYSGQTSLNVTLVEAATSVDAVVVTALGIKRQEKALSYNVQQIGAEEFTKVKDANFMNSLNGKVAGVTINSSAVGAGGAAKVIMRGTKSISQGNNALYVIDGIPMFNTSTGGAGDTTMSDQPGSDGVADLNPEDIESINMLTGPSAAALYGNSAASGVVLINTRKGVAGKTTLNVSNNTNFSTPYMLPQMQNKYGNRAGEASSWGTETNSDYDPRNFFATGANTMNSVSLSTGTAQNQTYMSVATTNASGMLPNNNYERYNFSFRNTSKMLKDKLTLDVGASYIIQKDKNQTASGQYFNPVPSLYLFPRGESFDEVRMYERWDESRGHYVQFWPYGNQGLSLQNPFWIANRMNRENNKKRYMFNGSLKYQIFDWLDVSGRARLDNSNTRATRKLYATTDKIFASDYGGYQETKTESRSFYGDVMLNINKTWDNWSVLVNLGASINDRREEMMGYAGDLRGNANFFSIHNLNYSAKFKPKAGGWHDQSQSIFASAEIGWKSMLYLTATLRNDWESQLAFTKAKSFLYPSVGMSAILSSMIEMPEWVSLLKLRGSYTQVGNSFNRYMTRLTYGFNEESKDWNALGKFPMYDLKPEDTKSFEVGFNLKLWKRFSVDATYYKSNSYNQTLSIGMSPSSGFSSITIQSGNIQNQGVELSVGYNNNWGDFEWSSNYNFTWNKNKVIELNSNQINPITGQVVELEFAELSSFGGTDARVKIYPGGSMGDVYATHMLLTDANGKIYVNPQTGSVEMAQVDEFKLGSTLPDYTMGWNNTFSYKGVDLGIVFTGRIGGIAVSGTQSILDQYGVSQRTADARDAGGIPINNGVVEAEKYYKTIAGNAAYYTYSATNLRLQEMNLNYTLPRKWFRNKMRMTVGVVAKNLWMIYCKAPFDPEMAPSTTTAAYSSYDYFMQPNMRNIGFSVKLQF